MKTILKKFAILACAVLTLSLTACDPHDSTTIDPNDLAGTWLLSVRNGIVTDAIDNGTATVIEATADGHWTLHTNFLGDAIPETWNTFQNLSYEIDNRDIVLSGTTSSGKLNVKARVILLTEVSISVRIIFVGANNEVPISLDNTFTFVRPADFSNVIKGAWNGDEWNATEKVNEDVTYSFVSDNMSRAENNTMTSPTLYKVYGNLVVLPHAGTDTAPVDFFYPVLIIGNELTFARKGDTNNPILFFKGTFVPEEEDNGTNPE